MKHSSRHGKSYTLRAGGFIALLVVVIVGAIMVIGYSLKNSSNTVDVVIVNNMSEPIQLMYCTVLNDNGTIDPGKTSKVSVGKNSGSSHNGCYVADPTRDNTYIGCIIPGKSVQSGDRYFITQMDTKTAW